MTKALSWFPLLFALTSCAAPGAGVMALDSDSTADGSTDVGEEDTKGESGDEETGAEETGAEETGEPLPRPGEMRWRTELSHDGPGESWGADMAVAGDGSVFVAGAMGPSGDADLLVSRLDQDGDEIWTMLHDHGLGLDDEANALTLGPDDFVFVAGEVYAEGEGKDGFLGGVDPTKGTLEWSHTFSGSATTVDSADAVSVNSDGEAVFIGMTNAGKTGWYRHLTILGDIVWGGGFAFAFRHELNDLEHLPEGDLLVAFGERQDAHWEPTLIQLGQEGGLAWIGDPPTGTGFLGELIAVDVHSSGDIVVAGHYSQGNSLDHPDGQVWFARLDTEGNPIWETTVGGDAGEDDFARDVVFDADGNVIVSYSLVHDDTRQDYVSKVDGRGQLLWRLTLDPTDSVRRLAVDTDGAVYFVGQAEHPQHQAPAEWTVLVGAIAP